MNVLIDRHHAALFHSLQLLGDRLGWDVYTPVGFDWWDRGYWTFGREAYGDARLRDQYLSTEDAAWSEWRHREDDGRWVTGVWETRDRDYPHRKIMGIELDAAREVPWAYVMATVQDNQRGFHRFSVETGATYLLQVGNTGQQVDWSLDPIALVSSEVPILGRGIRVHQEMAPAYSWREPTNRASIKTFVNYATHNRDCWPLAQRLWQALPDFDWSLHGAGMPDGIVSPQTRVADAMADAGWAYHDKPTGDGFGHVLWGWAAIGRPLIGHASHYAGKPGGVLWRDLVTCIDLDRRTVEEAAALIRRVSAEDHLWMCRNVHELYMEHHDPDRDAEGIRRLLGGNE